MRHVAAYILAVMGGNASPSEADLKSILSSVGVDAIDEHLKVVVGQLQGKDLFQLMEEGASLLAGMPMGGGAGAVSSGGSGGAAAEEAAEAPKEEAKKEESEDESDSDMGMGLFD